MIYTNYDKKARKQGQQSSGVARRKAGKVDKEADFYKLEPAQAAKRQQNQQEEEERSEAKATTREN